jgi:choline dehydrogenase-like flavoprotein
MHRDPSRGVVDQHSQVHGIKGLYVAGSSVFPTAGYVNPTLNIIAMSMRLADRLKKVLS